MQLISDFKMANKALLKFVPKTPTVVPYSLDKIVEIMNYLGNPQDSYRSIHVTGTSGKTSTCYYTAALLKELGYKVGLTVSPHIDEVNERVQIDLQPLPEIEYCALLTEFLNLVKKSGIALSYFEVLVAFAYWVFAKQKVDYAVIEVGLGGLLDGTNVITRSDKVCVITDIGMDHVEILGDTLPKIAAQKAGIILPSNHVFIHEQPTEVMDVVRLVCEQKGATLHYIEAADGLSKQSHLPLFQQRNLRLAAEAVSHAVDNKTLQDELIKKVADDTHIPARMEVVAFNEKTIIIDGSHNDQKIQALVEGIEERFGDTPTALLVSFGSNKRDAIEGMLKRLKVVSQDIVITAFSIGQDELRYAIDPHEIAEVCSKLGYKTVEIVENPEDALQKILTYSHPNILVTGSYFLLNHIRPQVLSEK